MSFKKGKQGDIFTYKNGFLPFNKKVFIVKEIDIS